MRIVRYKILKAVFGTSSNKINSLDLKGMREQEAGDIYMIRSFIICTFNHILILTKSRTRWASHRRDKKYKHSFSEKPEGKRPLRRSKCR
jgi:hypothetical protein